MDRNSGWPLYAAVFAFGFASMAAQVLLMRELFVVFYGNELCAGIMLAAWLFWVSIGSIAVRSKKYAEEIFHILLLSVPVVLPATVFFIRNIRGFLGASPGEIVGIFPMAASSFILLAPVCVTFGALFALSCRLAPAEPGKIYLVESAGAAAGGLVFSLFVISMVKPLAACVFCGLLTCVSVLIVAERKRSPPRWWTSFSFTALVLIFMLTAAGPLDLKLRQMQWHGFGLVDAKDTIYGNIARTARGQQSSIFENGLLVASSDDPVAAEGSVQFAMLEHPSPRRVLLIGGSAGGSLEQVLKHPVASVDYVEIDPELLKKSSDPRAKAHLMDGRLFVSELAQKGAAAYDVIILVLPNPYTAQVNRFYSLEFYRDIGKVLRQDGVFSFSVTSAGDYISPAQAQFLACLKNTLEKQFADIRIIPGDTAVFLASPSAGTLTYDDSVLSRRIGERGLKPDYVNAHYLPDIMDPARIKYAETAISAARNVKINRDFRPAGYYYDTVLWSARANPRFAGFLIALDGLDANTPVLIIAAVLAVLAAGYQAASKSRGFPYLLSIAAAGFSGMAAQVCLIIAFQAVYGYVYYKVGMIFAAFMAGLVIGSAVAMKITGAGEGPAKAYRRAQSLFYIYAFILALSFQAGFHFSQPVFFLLAAVPGILTGFMFPLAVHLHSAGSKKPAYSAGLIYGVDLAGACIGALLASAILIPVAGISRVFALAGFINLAATCLLYVQFLRSRT